MGTPSVFLVKFSNASLLACALPGFEVLGPSPLELPGACCSVPCRTGPGTADAPRQAVAIWAFCALESLPRRGHAKT